MSDKGRRGRNDFCQDGKDPRGNIKSTGKAATWKLGLEAVRASVDFAKKIRKIRHQTTGRVIENGGRKQG